MVGRGETERGRLIRSGEVSSDGRQGEAENPKKVPHLHGIAFSSKRQYRQNGFEKKKVGGVIIGWFFPTKLGIGHNWGGRPRVKTERERHTSKNCFRVDENWDLL